MRITRDYHNHTAFSKCSKKNYTAAEMLTRMREQGFTSVGLVDHFYPDETDVAAQLAFLRGQAALVPGLRVALGVEVDMDAPGLLTADAATLAPFDYVLAACPHWHSPTATLPLRRTEESLAQMQYDYLLAASVHPDIDVICHPFTFEHARRWLPGLSQTRLMKAFTSADLDAIIDGLTLTGKAVELHANLADPEVAASLRPFFTRCIERGVRLSLGSDAHELATVGKIRQAQPFLDSLRIPEALLWEPPIKG